MRKALLSQEIVGLMVQAMAVALVIWARFTLGRRSFHAAATPTPGHLVTNGPYRVIRHPIYAGILYFTWAGLFTHFSPLNVGLGLMISLAVGARIKAEENLLHDTYPEYKPYVSRTKRIVPFLF